MLISLNDQRMLALWRQGAGLEPAAIDSSIERFDSLEVDSRLLTAMRAWYVAYLHEAPLDMVPVTEITDTVSVLQGSRADQWHLRTDRPVARFVSLSLDGKGCIPIVNPFDENNLQLVTSLSNRFVRQGCLSVALYAPGKDSIVVHSIQKPVPAAVRAVVIPDDDTYIVDERAFSQIPSLARQALDI